MEAGLAPDGESAATSRRQCRQRQMTYFLSYNSKSPKNAGAFFFNPPSNEKKPLSGYFLLNFN